MYKCKNCGEDIRWSEFMGWVHGPLGSGYREECIDRNTKAEARSEDFEWLHGKEDN